MAKGEQKVYMPLVIGDWLKGTRGMRADVKGVYVGLLLHQWEKGYITADLDELTLVEPEVGKVWDKLKEKFEVVAPGRLQNKHCEEVREFWAKQKSNGTKGGRPRNKENPKYNPNNIPNPNLHNDHDLDTDHEVNEDRGAGERRISTATLDDHMHVDWEKWGTLIVDDGDPTWQAMRGRRVTRQEMDQFISVATRCGWKLDTAQKFRTSLRGFDAKKGLDSTQTKRPKVDMSKI